MVSEDHLADCLFLVLVNSVRNQCQPLFVLSKSLFQLFCDRADVPFSCLLVICKHSFFHGFRCHHLFDRRKQFFRNCTALIRVFFFSAFCHDLIYKCNDLTVHFMSQENCLDHLVFRNLVGSGFDHDHFFSCGCNGKLQV